MCLSILFVQSLPSLCLHQWDQCNFSGKEEGELGTWLPHKVLSCAISSDAEPKSLTSLCQYLSSSRCLARAFLHSKTVSNNFTPCTDVHRPIDCGRAVTACAFGWPGRTENLRSHQLSCRDKGWLFIRSTALQVLQQSHGGKKCNDFVPCHTIRRAMCCY